MTRTIKEDILESVRTRVNARVEYLMDVYEGRIKFISEKKRRGFQGNVNPIKCGKGDKIRRQIKKEMKDAGFSEDSIQ